MAKDIIGKPKSDAATHKGHRKRMKKRYLENFGFEGFEPHEILEVLLYYVIPQKDTNPIAHRLLDNFGSISAVLDAPIDSLVQAGLTESSAVYLTMIPQISRLYLDDKHNNRSKIVDLDNIGEHLKYKFIGRDSEVVVLLLLDAKGKELFCGVVSHGSINSANMPIREIISLAIRFNASSAIIAHNHPSGVAIPSREDIGVTGTLFESLEAIGVVLEDHYIFADFDYISMAESKYNSGIFYS